MQIIHLLQATYLHNAHERRRVWSSRWILVSVSVLANTGQQLYQLVVTSLLLSTGKWRRRQQTASPLETTAG